MKTKDYHEAIEEKYTKEKGIVEEWYNKQSSTPPPNPENAPSDKGKKDEKTNPNNNVDPDEEHKNKERYKALLPLQSIELNSFPSDKDSELKEALTTF